MTFKFIAAAALAALSLPALAQPQEPYPNKLIRVVVPYGSGTGADILARLMGPKLSERWNVPVVVENRVGAAAVLGHDHLAKSAPNGYTMGFSATSFTTNAAFLRGKLPYDPIRSFEQVALLATNITSFVISNKVPVNSLAEFLALARKQPGKLNYASPTIGTPQHLGMELLKLEAKVDIVNVPYKASPGAITDLIAGHVQAMVIPIQTAAPHVRAGQLRMLAVMSASRSPAFPDVPTMRELGMPAVDVDTWYGVFAPAGTPKDIVAKWNAELNALLKQPDVLQSFEKQGLTPAGGPPQRMTRLLQEDIARWTRVVTEANIKPPE